MSEQQSEKFSMLRNVVENLECPLKRKILLDFLDQSTLKTQYFTVKESSSSGEEMKRLQGLEKLLKRRRKSPPSVLPQAKLHQNRRVENAHSQERKRFSTAKPRMKTTTSRRQNLQKFRIERKHDSDDFGSKNGDKCYTEESKEVPLEAILDKIPGFNPFQTRSRGLSGYSVSREEMTYPEDFHHRTMCVDLEANFEFEDNHKPKFKEILVVPADLIDNKITSEQTVGARIIQKWANKFKSAMFIVLVIFFLIL